MLVLVTMSRFLAQIPARVLEETAHSQYRKGKASLSRCDSDRREAVTLSTKHVTSTSAVSIRKAKSHKLDTGIALWLRNLLDSCSRMLVPCY